MTLQILPEVAASGGEKSYFCINGRFIEDRDQALKCAERAEVIHTATFSCKESKPKFATHLRGIGIKFPNKEAFDSAKGALHVLPEGVVLRAEDEKWSRTLLLSFDASYPVDEAKDCVAELKAAFEGVATVTTQIPFGAAAKACMGKPAPATNPEEIQRALDAAIEKLKAAKERPKAALDDSGAPEGSEETSGLKSNLPAGEVRVDLCEYPGFHKTIPVQRYDLTMEQAFDFVTHGGKPFETKDKNSGPYFTGPMGVAPWVAKTKKMMDKAREQDPTVPYEGIQRSASHSLGGSVFKFDLDDISEAALNSARERLSASGLAARMFTTHSHGAEAKGNRYRVVVLADRKASVDEFKATSERLGRELFGDSYDTTEHNPYQQAGVWMTHPDRKHLASCERFEGTAVSLDKVLTLAEAKGEAGTKGATKKPERTDLLLGGKTAPEITEDLRQELTRGTKHGADEAKESNDPLPVWDEACFNTLMEALTHSNIHDVASPDQNPTQGQVLSALKKSAELSPLAYHRQAAGLCEALYLAYATNNRRGYTREQVEADWEGDKFGGFSRAPFYIVEIAQKLGFDCGHITKKSKAAVGAARGDVKLVQASEITAEPIRWLWEGQLAKGKIHILGGKPGTSKTTMAMNLAAIISSGGELPDGKRCDAGNVLIWSGEDDPKDTLVPRLIANEADTDRVFFVDGTIDASGNMLPFDPARDIARLQETAKALDDVSMVIVDPIVSAVAGDGNSNSEVRRDLQPLVDLAENLDCAVVGITHFTKGSGGQAAVDRITGSLAFGAVARIIHVCFRPKDPADGEFAFMRGKSNISAVGGGFLYDIEQVFLPGTTIKASRIKWRGTISGLAEAALAAAEADEKDKPALELAKEFLNDRLAAGPMQFCDLLAEAKSEGISESTLQRASRVMNVQRSKWGYGKKSTTWWNLITNPWPSNWEGLKQNWGNEKEA